MVHAHLANERRLLSALSDDERNTLAALLRKLLVEFEGSAPPADAPLRLGLTVAPAHVTIALRESVGLKPVPALPVSAVEGNGPGATASIRTGDVLLRAGRRELRSVASLCAALYDDAADARSLNLKVLRGTDEHRVTVRLGGAGLVAGTPTTATGGRTTSGRYLV